MSLASVHARKIAAAAAGSAPAVGTAAAAVAAAAAPTASRRRLAAPMHAHTVAAPAGVAVRALHCASQRRMAAPLFRLHRLQQQQQRGLSTAAAAEPQTAAAETEAATADETGAASSTTAGPTPPVVTAEERTETDALLLAWASLSPEERAAEDVQMAPALYYRLLRGGRGEDAWRVHAEAEAAAIIALQKGSDAGAAAAAAAAAADPESLDAASTAGVWTLARTRVWLEALEQHGWAGDIAEAERAYLRLVGSGGQADAALYRQMIQLYMWHGGPAQLEKAEAFWAEARARTSFSTSDFGKLILWARQCGLPEQVQLWSARARVAGAFDSLDERTRFAEVIQARDEILDQLLALSVRVRGRFPRRDPDVPHANEVVRDREFIYLRQDAIELFRKLFHFSAQRLVQSYRLRWAEVAMLLDALRDFDLYSEALPLFGVVHQQELHAVQQEQFAQRWQRERMRMLEQQRAAQAGMAGLATIFHRGAVVAQAQTQAQPQEQAAAPAEATPAAEVSSAAGAGTAATTASSTPSPSPSPSPAQAIVPTAAAARAEQLPPPTPLPWSERMPSALVFRLLSAVARAPEGTGAEGARHVLLDMLSPECAGRFQLRPAETTTFVMALYRAEQRQRFDLAAKARTIYDAFCSRAEGQGQGQAQPGLGELHAAMYQEYARSHLAAEARALAAGLESRPTDATTVALAVRSLSEQVREAQEQEDLDAESSGELLERGKALWSKAAAAPAQLLVPAVTRGLVGLFGLAEEFGRAWEVINEAARLEKGGGVAAPAAADEAPAAEGAAAAEAADATTGAPAATPASSATTATTAATPVFLDNSAFAELFDALASSDQAKQHATLAEEALSLMQQRQQQQAATPTSAAFDDAMRSYARFLAAASRS